MTAEPIGSLEAMDAAFAGRAAELLDRAGRSRPMALRRWAGPADPVDHALLLARCHGRTLDVGCGPGRLVAELVGRSDSALGIDVSAEAVRQARRRGALALRRNVFAPVPGEGRWDSVLLADGNIGIGGRPVHLLRRVRQLLHGDGRVVVELDPEATGVEHHQWRFRVGERVSPLFDWALVGVDGVTPVARAAGLVVEDVARLDGRHAAVLRHDAEAA